MKRCTWASDSANELMIAYHDDEYGNMINDNRALFELLCLEIMQTGLSWNIVLQKRAAFKEFFLNFEVNDLIKMPHDDIIKLSENKAIIRNKMKIAAIINNAHIIVENKLDLKEYVLKNFNEYQSDYQKAAKQYKKDGFKFIGPSVVESLYKAIGLEEGHEKECFKYGRKNII